MVSIVSVVFTSLIAKIIDYRYNVKKYLYDKREKPYEQFISIIYTVMERIPFEVSVDPFFSQENMTRLKNSEAQMEATGGTVHEVDFDD